MEVSLVTGTSFCSGQATVAGRNIYVALSFPFLARSLLQMQMASLSPPILVQDQPQFLLLTFVQDKHTLCVQFALAQDQHTLFAVHICTG